MGGPNIGISSGQQYRPQTQLNQQSGAIWAGSCTLPSAPAEAEGQAASTSSTPLDTYLDRLLAAGGMTDLAFAVLALQIQEQNQDINTKIKGLQQQSKFREQISKQIDKYRRLQTLLHGDLGGKDGEISLSDLAKHDNQWSFNSKVGVSADHVQQLAEKYDLLDISYQVQDGQLVQSGANLLGAGRPVGEMTGIELKGYRLNTDMVEQKIEQLTDQLQRMDQSREIEMIQLNALISQKGQNVQLLSNLVKKRDDTRSSVINNLR